MFNSIKNEYGPARFAGPEFPGRIFVPTLPCAASHRGNLGKARRVGGSGEISGSIGRPLIV